MADPKHVEPPKTEVQPKGAKVEGDWRKAMAIALTKKKPASAWPEPPGRYGNKKTRAKSK